jgi:hypothetical protein
MRVVYRQRRDTRSSACDLLIRGNGQACRGWCFPGLFCPIQGAQAACRPARLAISISDSLHTCRRPAANPRETEPAPERWRSTERWLSRCGASLAWRKVPWIHGSPAALLPLQVDASHAPPPAEYHQRTRLAARVRQTWLAVQAVYCSAVPAWFFDQAPPVLGSGLRPPHIGFCAHREPAARPSIAHPSHNAHAASSMALLLSGPAAASSSDLPRRHPVAYLDLATFSWACPTIPIRVNP